MVSLINYGVGNLESIQNMLKRIGVESVVTNDAEVIRQASHLILPGVGAFDTCAEKLKQSNLVPIIEEQVLGRKIPVLGVCVGMQFLLEYSEEGSLPGLGWIKGSNVKFDLSKLPATHRIPHMGWTDVVPMKPSRLLAGIADPRFYFVHSYHAQLKNSEDGNIQATYGYSFVAGVERDNILGVQFHPEKSHKYGMKLLDNFVNKY